ncbi:MAG: PEGA domain-containing protein [Bryobacteraceae bacterium]|nr:PEGA domain-containing protein [Bryobacteraceae bacterium]
MSSNARIECMLGLALLSIYPASASDDEEKTLRITSEPPGAHVILNGRDRGTTPLEWKVGHWAFDSKKSSVFSKHLSEPWVLEISKDGYRTESIRLTRGPYYWRSFNGQNSYQYWVLNAPSYDVKLRPATRALTNADVVLLLKSGLGEDLIIEKIKTSSCEFRTDPEDLKALHDGGISDAIIAEMMHAVPADQAGPATTIRPVKK